LTKSATDLWLDDFSKLLKNATIIQTNCLINQATST